METTATTLTTTTPRGEDPEDLLFLRPVDPRPLGPPGASNIFNKSCAEDGWYGLWRKDCGPTLYSSNKTPVTADVLEAGFIFAAVILALSLTVLALGVRGRKTRWFFPIRAFLALFILTSILLCNFGQEWEVATLYTKTPYRAGLSEEIHAHVGVKIGLRSVNITLRADPEVVTFKNGLHEERINYNERYSWNNLGFDLGRRGFGPYAGRLNREFRASQWRGTPLPILWVAEYLTLDGEGIRWGRHYLQAGWYTHIMMWLAFPLWILSMVQFYMVISYGAMFSLFTGLALGTANLTFMFIRNPLDIDGVIPFEDGHLRFHYGWCFWMNLVTASLCTLIGLLFLLLDCFNVEALATFLNKDIQQEFEDVYIEVPNGADVESLPEDTADVHMVRSFSQVSAMSSSSQLRQYLVCHYQRRRGTNGSLIGKLQKQGRRPTILRSAFSRDDASNSTQATPRPSFQLAAPQFPRSKVRAAESPSKQVNWGDMTGVYDNVDLSAEFRERLMRQRSSAATIYEEEQEMDHIRDVVVEIEASPDSSFGDENQLIRSTSDSLPDSLPETPAVETPKSPPPCTANLINIPLFNGVRKGSTSSYVLSEAAGSSSNVQVHEEDVAGAEIMAPNVGSDPFNFLKEADCGGAGSATKKRPNNLDLFSSVNSQRRTPSSSRSQSPASNSSQSRNSTPRSSHQQSPTPSSSRSQSTAPSSSHSQSPAPSSSHSQSPSPSSSHSQSPAPSSSHSQSPAPSSSHSLRIPTKGSSQGSSTMSCSPVAMDEDVNCDHYDNVFVHKL